MQFIRCRFPALSDRLEVSWRGRPTPAEASSSIIQPNYLHRFFPYRIRETDFLARQLDVTVLGVVVEELAAVKVTASGKPDWPATGYGALGNASYMKE